MKKFYFIPRTFCYRSVFNLIWCHFAHKVNCLYQDWKHGIPIGTGDWLDKWSPYYYTHRNPTELELEKYGAVNFVVTTYDEDLPFNKIKY